MLPLRPVRALNRLDRRERPFVRAGRGLRERRRALGRVSRSSLVESPVASEAPGAADEDADADPLALDVVDLVDAAVFRRDQLRAPNDPARIGVRRASGERGGDGFFADRSHVANPNAGRPDTVATILARAGGGIGRRARRRRKVRPAARGMTTSRR